MSRIRGPYVRFCERDEAVTPHPTRCVCYWYRKRERKNNNNLNNCSNKRSESWVQRIEFYFDVYLYKAAYRDLACTLKD